MSRSAIEAIVARVDSNTLSPSPEMVYAGVEVAFSNCRPYQWDRVAFENALGVTVPHDLEHLWALTSGLRLYEDMTYGQWGLVVWDPDTVIARNELRGDRQTDFTIGDLVIGEFLGDSDLLMLRADGAAADFEQAMIVLPIDRRPSWPIVGSTLSDFLERFLQTNGQKFWPG